VWYGGVVFGFVDRIISRIGCESVDSMILLGKVLSPKTLVSQGVQGNSREKHSRESLFSADFPDFFPWISLEISQN